MDLGGPNGDLLLRLMSATSLRAKVIAGNVSNQNTPGFQRRKVEFEEALVRELERGKPDVERIQPEVVVDPDASPRADGNTVQMEDEVAAMRQNRILYEIYASIMSGRGRLLRSAIHGDR
ncbi:MAG: flagellar biosynthesis protein FlgB [bacterium]|nr:flagellar biosynthesis protein FlgB [bacterium]